MSDRIKQLEEKIDKLEAYVDRVQAAQECANLMGRYLYYHSAFRHKEYVDMWADRDDCILEMPGSTFIGKEGVKHCYLVCHPDRDDPGQREGGLKGSMMIHTCTTPVIEVAEDGMTARGVWLSPGLETKKSFTSGEFEGTWAWSKYGVDFIKENGVWKFWHLHLYGVFITPYDTCWTDAKPYGSEKIELPEEMLGKGGLPPKREPSPYERPCVLPVWSYTKDSVYPAYQPDPPVKYVSFEDIHTVPFVGEGQIEVG